MASWLTDGAFQPPFTLNITIKITVASVIGHLGNVVRQQGPKRS